MESRIVFHRVVIRLLKGTAWPIIFGLLWMIVACGGSDDTIRIDGSSTVFPITEAVAEEFSKANSGVNLLVGASGTGGGFERFVRGNTDINDASRPIESLEADKASENGIDFLELPIAIDGLSVMVNPENEFVACLTVEELKRIWEPGSEIDSWRDVRPEWPDQKLRLYGPDTDSGTFDYFTEVIVGESRASRADYTASADDNVLVRGVSGDRRALGYFGYAFFVENVEDLKLVAVDSGDGCVLPTPETIQDGTYTPLSRPLFIYVSKQSLERPGVKAFVEFYLANAAALAAEVGYLGLTSSEYQESLAKIQ